MRTRVLLIAAAAFMFMLPAQVVAQVNIGPQLSFGDDTDVGIGGRVVANVESLEHWDFVGTFDIWFLDDGANTDRSAWEANGNLAYNFAIENSSLAPYAGGGLSIFHFSAENRNTGAEFDDTELGVNFLGGLKFPGESTTPFVELRGVFEGAEQLVITGGLLF